MDQEMITQGNWDNFLTLENEELLLVKRKHPFVIFFPSVLIVVIIVFFVTAAVLFFTSLIPSLSLLLVTIMLLVSLLLTSLTKCIMDWYFHVYILTSRKILEVRYAPLYSHIMNDVLLDRVNCTEVDFRRSGFINELLDIGDVVITFDRPTHQEEFIIKDINHSYKLGKYLTKKLLGKADILMQPIWFKSHKTIPSR